MKSRQFKVVRDPSLDFVGEAYATLYPNLHRYPATMIPQLGVALLERLGYAGGSLLDPYCGSGSSFASAIHVGMTGLQGNDLNPLAVMISQAKFIRTPKGLLLNGFGKLASDVSKLKSRKVKESELPKITNLDYWFPRSSLPYLVGIRSLIGEIADERVRRLALIAFSETVRDTSYTRKNEFKLYRMSPERLARFDPDPKSIFLTYLKRIETNYLERYLPTLKGVSIRLQSEAFISSKTEVDVVLTSPPYGDSGTTVAYGQFSCLTNEWLGIEGARKIDSRLMGGKRAIALLDNGVLASQIQEVAKVQHKRALEVSSFYEDLGESIANVATAVKSGGHAIYIVGNRRVKDVQLATDQFIAEEFSKAGFSHVVTYERALTSKSMPLSNSPSNLVGATRGTMTQEFIVICKKR